MFAYQTSYKNYEIWSDKPIPSEISKVLDDANKRLKTSNLYNENDKINLFFCNESWRIWIYGQHFSQRVGGFADTWLTKNVYIRSSDIVNNKINPHNGILADAEQRPISYFIAHEVTHLIEANKYGATIFLKYPTWLTEGYADYIGKGRNFDFNENHKLFKLGIHLLDAKKSGLYREYQLKVQYLIEKKGLRVEQIFGNPPNEDDLDKELKNLPIN